MVICDRKNSLTSRCSGTCEKVVRRAEALSQDVLRDGAPEKHRVPAAAAAAAAPKPPHLSPHLLDVASIYPPPSLPDWQKQVGHISDLLNIIPVSSDLEGAGVEGWWGRDQMLAAPLESVPIMAVWRRLSDEEWEMTGDALASRRSEWHAVATRCVSHGGTVLQVCGGTRGGMDATSLSSNRILLQIQQGASTVFMSYKGDIMTDGSVQPLLIISLYVYAFILNWVFFS